MHRQLQTLQSTHREQFECLNERPYEIWIGNDGVESVIERDNEFRFDDVEMQTIAAENSANVLIISGKS